MDSCFMLSALSTSTANYLQTIFRVQSPCKKMVIKQCCYVFDFALIARSKWWQNPLQSHKGGKTGGDDRKSSVNFELLSCYLRRWYRDEKYNTNNLLHQQNAPMRLAYRTVLMIQIYIMTSCSNLTVWLLMILPTLRKL